MDVLVPETCQGMTSGASVQNLELWLLANTYSVNILVILSRRLLKLINPTIKHGIQLAGDIGGVDLDGLHASEDSEFEGLAFLVENIESIPQSFLRLGPEFLETLSTTSQEAELTPWTSEH